MRVGDTRLLMEGIALTGAWVDREKGLLSLIALELGVSSRLCAYLRPGEQFEYTSGCPLPTPVGSMRGSYQCVAADGTEFEVPIPEFVLSMPNRLH